MEPSKRTRVVLSLSPIIPKSFPFVILYLIGNVLSLITRLEILSKPVRLLPACTLLLLPVAAEFAAVIGALLPCGITTVLADEFGVAVYYYCYNYS